MAKQPQNVRIAIDQQCLSQKKKKSGPVRSEVVLR